MLRLPDGSIIQSPGDWLLFNGVKYPFYRMTDADLAELGITRVIPPPQPVVDPNFYYISQEGPPVAKPMLVIQDMLKRKVAEDRWQAELKGITLAGGKKIPADDTSLIRMLLAYVVARSNPAFTISNFRLVDGSYVNLTNAQIINSFENIATRILTTLYSKNQQIDAQIDALQTVEAAQTFTWSWE